MLNFQRFVLAVLLSASFSGAYAEECPVPPTSIVPQLEIGVTHDKNAGLYKYRYTLKNGSTAKLAINNFGLFLRQPPTRIITAAHWRSRFVVHPEGENKLSWFTTEIGKEAASRPYAGGAMAPALYAVKAGSSLDGFEIHSSQPPGILEFYAIGDELKGIRGDDGEPQECPGWSHSEPNRVSGLTAGPSDPDVISVKIRTRDKSGLHHSSPIDPKNSKGQMSVLVISTPSFDASQVNISSVAFGPAQVAPVSSELIPTNRGEKLEGDELSAWEKAIESTESKDEKKRHSQNLLLTFDVAALDVQCGIDLALFLRGETKTGQKFIGAAPAKVVGCKAGEPGVHKPPKKKQGKK